MSYLRHLTAAVRDAVQATGISVTDTNRYDAAYRKTNRALTGLFEQAALRGCDEAVISGFFKLSANEPHRLPKLVDSVVLLRLPEVGRALIEYDRTH